MLIASQQHVSQVQKVAFITNEENILFTPTVNLFGAQIPVTEMRQESKFFPKSEILNAYCISATHNFYQKRCFDHYRSKYYYLPQLSIFLDLIHMSLRCDSV